MHQYWFVLIIWLISLSLSAQNYPAKQFTIQDGLPSMDIKCVFKDSRNFLWVGTDAGLCRFDGKSFKIFKPSDGLSSSRIWAIAEDEQGNLWFGSYGDGLFKYDGRQFTQYTKKDGLSDDRVRVLLYSKKFQRLFAGTQEGFSTIKGDTIISAPEKVFTLFGGGCITGLIEIDSHILITTFGPNNPVRHNPDKNDFVILHDQGKHYPEVSFSGFLRSYGDTVLSRTTRGVRIYGKNGMVEKDTLGQVFSITEDKRGDLWMAAWSCQNMELSGGLFRWDGKTFRNFNESIGIKERGVWTLFYDRDQDILWIGTDTEGLFRVSFPYFKTYTASYFKPEPQKFNDLHLDSDQTLWISGTRELIRMKPDGSYTFMDKYPMVQAYRAFWNDPRQKKIAPMGSTMLKAKNAAAGQLPEFIKETEFNFYQVIQDNSQSMLYSCELGLFRYDTRIQETDYLGQEGGIGQLAMMGDTLIISVVDQTALNPNIKANRFNSDNFYFFPSDLFLTFNKELEPKEVTRIVKQNDFTWYTSATSGLWMSRGLSLIHFNTLDSTISNNLNDICIDSHNHLIFGSNTGEIYIGTYDGKKLEIDYQLNGDDGLHGNSIKWLLADSSDHLWVGTNEGLSCLDLNELYSKDTCQIRFLDKESGYLGQTSTRSVMDSLGNLWVTAGDQLIQVNTRNILADQSQPGKVILNSLEINQSPADSLIGHDIIDLQHSENELVFHFDILNYLDPGKDLFRYMLRGYDKNWHDWDIERKAVYTNLPPGNYVFCAEAVNIRTLGKAKSLEVGFKIKHAWWQLWYLQAFLVILLVFLFAFLILKYVEQQKQKQQREIELEKEMLHLQYISIANQFNPHLTFNLFNTVAGFLHSSQKDQALNLTNKYAQLLRSVLLKGSSFKISLSEELTAVSDLLELEAISTEGIFSYSIQSSPEHGEISIPRSLVFMFVENSIKHGARAQPQRPVILVKSLKEGSTLIIEIMDNGPGLSLQKDSNSNGTRSGFRIIDEVIDLYFKHSKQRISYEFHPAADSSPDSFTVVRIRVPMTEY
jgi:ligand-binding sensor domain-containing protein